MKKPSSILLALIGVIALTGTAKLNSAPPSKNPGPKKLAVATCAKVGGKYDVTKIINSLNCTKGGAAVTIPDWQNAMAETSTLTLGNGDTANKCKVSGADAIKGSNLSVPVAGMICINPAAPASELTRVTKRLSCRISPYTQA